MQLLRSKGDRLVLFYSGFFLCGGDSLSFNLQAMSHCFIVTGVEVVFNCGEDKKEFIAD